MEMDLKLKLEVTFPQKKNAEAAYSALSHEANVEARAKASIKLENKKIEIEIASSDAVSLRAGANSYLRILQAIDGIEKDE
jgi:tRNA threonylcarbamoyladenosine modification (KEOPS) complex  Pcc1 subunit